ncbi:MAG: hypothetical protein WBC06_09305, partial [Chitinophagaceae bacterium]
NAQQIDSIRFFTDEQLIEMNLTTDIRGLQSQKGEDVFQTGTVTMKFPDSSVITETIAVSPRGKFRRGYCRIPPMMINFRNDGASKLSQLGKLKMVLGCGVKVDDEQLLLKEFLIYKIYNLLEEKSFRVRLLNTNYIDSKNRVKPFSQYSFLIEDDGDLARRTNSKKKEHGQYLTEATDRNMMTMVAIFQYMIGNTDWAVPNNHNIKLLFDKFNDAAFPYAIPYDFDYCGLVDASYAVPNEIIGTEKVTERVYRGFPRTMEEVQSTLDVFRAKKNSIISLITNFTLVTDRNRKVMIDYLEEFYKIIENKNKVKLIFIDNARTS